MKKLSQRSVLIVGVLMMAAWWVSMARWHQRDTRPPSWDESVHLNLALDYKALFQHGTSVTTQWAEDYPPLFHLSLIPFLSIGTSEAGNISSLQALYIVLLIAGLVLLAAEMSLALEIGLWGGLLFAGYRLVLIVSRRPLMDVGLSAWVCMGMALLWRTHDFTDRRRTLVWGFFCGLGFLLKPPFPAFFVLPCLYLLWRSSSQERAQRFKNLGLGVGAAALISFPWYGWRGAVFLNRLFQMTVICGVNEKDPSFITPAGWLYYLRAFYSQMGGWSWLFTGVGLGLLFIRRHRVPRDIITFLSLWSLSGYLAFTLVPNKDTRYTLALLPAVAMLSTMGWSLLSQKTTNRWTLGLMALCLFFWNAKRYDPPLTQNWQHLAIGQLLERSRDPKQPLLLVSVISNHPYFFGRSLRWTMRAQGWPMNTSKPGDPTTDFTEFIVTKSGDMGPSAEHLADELHQLQKSGREFHALFKPIGRFPLPDQSEAVVYRRDPQHRFQVGPQSKEALQQRLLQIIQTPIQGLLKLSIQGTPVDWQQGYFPEIHLLGSSCTIRGLRVTRLELRAEGIWLNLYRVVDQKTLGLLAFSSLSPVVEIQARDVENLLNQRVKGIEDIRVSFDRGFLNLQARWKQVPLAVRAHVEITPGSKLQVIVDTLHIGPVPIPGWILGQLHCYAVPLSPIPPFPGQILIHTLRLDENRLLIS